MGSCRAVSGARDCGDMKPEALLGLKLGMQGQWKAVRVALHHIALRNMTAN